MRGRLLALSAALFLALGGVPAYADSSSPAQDQLDGKTTLGVSVHDAMRSPALTRATDDSRFPGGGVWVWSLAAILSAGALAAVGAAVRRRERRQRHGLEA